MKYVIYGAGAVGGVIGGHLALAGHATTLVARGEHLDPDPGGRAPAGHGGRHARDPGAGHRHRRRRRLDRGHRLSPRSEVPPGAAALDDLAAHAPPSTPVFCATNGVATEVAALRRFPGSTGCA